MRMRFTPVCLALILFIGNAHVSKAQPLASAGDAEMNTNSVVEAILPMRLASFSGKIIQHTIQLNWQTLEEINGHLINIERSYDGLAFTKIGTLPSLGNTSLGHHYSFTDRDMIRPVAYYRLKMLDKNDYFECSTVIILKSQPASKLIFTLLTNPVCNSLEIQFGAVTGGSAEIRLLDISGRLVQNWTGSISSKQYLQIPVSNSLRPGIYLVQVVQGGKQFVQQLVKQ